MCYMLCVRNPTFGLLQISHKLEKRQWPHNFPTWHHRQVLFGVVFWGFFVFLVMFSYWSKFHVNTITGSGVMTIFFYKGLTRNPEIGYNPVWVLPNIWGQGRVRNAKFSTNASNEILPNVAKCQGHSFYRFWVMKGKPTGRVKLLLSNPD